MPVGWQNFPLSAQQYRNQFPDWTQGPIVLSFQWQCEDLEKQAAYFRPTCRNVAKSKWDTLSICSLGANPISHWRDRCPVYVTQILSNCVPLFQCSHWEVRQTSHWSMTLAREDLGALQPTPTTPLPFNYPWTPTPLNTHTLPGRNWCLRWLSISQSWTTAL